MSRNTLALSSALMFVTMVAVAVAVGLSTPADLLLPTHWGLDGEPDRLSEKWTALLTPPLPAA